MRVILNSLGASCAHRISLVKITTSKAAKTDTSKAAKIGTTLPVKTDTSSRLSRNRSSNSNSLNNLPSHACSPP